MQRLIPESVVQITSVTSLKTAVFKNGFGEYSYKSVRDDLMFGYAPRPLADGRATAYATREKALLDLLYLYPFYDTEQALADLRLDEDTLHEDLNRAELESLAARFHSMALEKRLRLLSKAYGLGSLMAQTQPDYRYHKASKGLRTPMPVWLAVCR